MGINPLESGRGITMLAKNTADPLQRREFNTIDTLGRADFSGEIERIMNLAYGCLLVVDSADGPMAQT